MSDVVRPLRPPPLVEAIYSSIVRASATTPLCPVNLDNTLPCNQSDALATFRVRCTITRSFIRMR